MARRLRSEKTEVPMSAMIDVVFLLLVFFIATKKPNIPEAHVAINMPSPNPSTSTDIPPPPLMEVHVLPNGRYMLLGRARKSLDQFEELFIDIALNNPDSTVIIKVAPDATEGDLVDLLDRASKANLHNLNVMMLAGG